MPDRPEASPFKERLVSVPHPGAILAPVKEKPNTVEPPAETVKPELDASPPDAPETVAPSTAVSYTHLTLPTIYSV